jgi:hypothetical protein
MPQAAAYDYADPNLGCKAGSMNVSITGVKGDFCSPPCDSSNNCPTECVGWVWRVA